MMNNEIKIEKNRKTETIWKIILMVVGCVCYSNLFLKSNFYSAPKDTLDKIVFYILAVLLLVYFVMIVWEIVKFFDKRKEANPIAFTLNEDGIIVENLPIIHWKDIEAVGFSTLITGSLLMIKVSNPLDYIAKVEDDFQLKKILRQNNAKYQTPFAIKVNNLKIKPHELRDLIKEKLKEHRTKIGWESFSEKP
ncbi:MAG: STM3941 family protein [Bergeyella zoohelcum]|nr:STM3941 family protein [Bergeyella zoohelcum]